MNYAVDRNRWARLSIFEQMGNIYSEVGRALKAKCNRNNEGCQQAVVRALDLFDATVEVQITRSPARAKEILRAREQFLQAVYVTPPDSPELNKLDSYFMHYAVAARLATTH